MNETEGSDWYKNRLEAAVMHLWTSLNTCRNPHLHMTEFKDRKESVKREYSDADRTLDKWEGLYRSLIGKVVVGK